MRKSQRVRCRKLIAAATAVSGLHAASMTAMGTSYAASWIAPGGSSWSDPTAWSVAPNYPNNFQPNLSDHYSAYIGPLSPGAVISTGAQVTLDYLTLASPGTVLHLSAAQLLNGGSISGGTLDIGSFATEGDLNIASNLTWDPEATLSGFGNVNILPGGSFNVAQTGALSTTINNAGTILLGNIGSDISFSNGTLNNLSSGVITSSSLAGLGQNPSGGFFNNQGLINITSGQFGLAVPMLDAGTINVANGTLQFSGTAGSLTPNTYTYTNGAVISGAGTVMLGTGTVTHNLAGVATFSAGFFSMDGCTITGPGTINLTSTMKWNGGTISGSGALNIAPGASLTVGTSSLYNRVLNGTINNSGTLDFDLSGINSGTGTLNNLPGGTILLYNGSAFGGSISFANAGTMIAEVNVILPNKIFDSGTYVINKGVTVNCAAGSFSYGGGAAITGAGTFNFSTGTQTFYGPVSVSAANVTLPASATIAGSGDLNIQSGCSFTFGGSILTGPGAVNIAVGGAASFDTGTSSRNVNNSGSALFSLVPPTFSGATFTNLPGGIATFKTPSTVRWAFTNAGTVSVSNGVLQLHDGMIYNTGANFSGNGTVLLSQGTLNGNLNLYNTNSVFDDGTFANITGPGDLDINANATMSWNNGIIDGHGAMNVSSGGTLNIGTASLSTVVLNRTLNNSGTINLVGAFASGTINNQSSGWMNVSNTSAFTGSGTSIFGLTNYGTIVFNATSTLDLYQPVTNSGTFIVNTGTLALGSNLTEVNSYLTGAGSIYLSGILAGNMTLAASNQYLNAATTISGPGDIDLNTTLNWGAGTIGNGGGAFRIAQGATLNLFTSSTRTLNRNLINSGVVNIPVTLTFGTNGQITNTASGIINYSSGSSINGALNNAGTVNVLSGTSYAPGGSNWVNNTGTIIVGNGTSAATLSLNTSAVQMDYTHHVLTGGNWIVLAGSQILDGDVLTANEARVTLNGVGASFPDFARLTESGGTLSILNGATLTTNGSFTNDGITQVGSHSFLRSTGTLANTGTLDIDGLAISDYSSTSPQSALAPQLATGFAGGTWTGPGINSDLAALIAADPTNIHKTAIGYAEASDLGITSTGTFDGQPVDNTTFTLRYVYSGDANLDGTVDSSDFSILAAHYGMTGQNWDDGDYNYDGTVNALDFNALATNYGQSISSADIPDATLPFASTLVPEPMVVMIPVLLALNVRRRRRGSESPSSSNHAARR